MNLFFRPHAPGDEDLNVGSDEAIIPNAMLVHTDILEIVLNIRNASLRKDILMKEDIDFTIADEVLIKDKNKKPETVIKAGDIVALRIDVATQMPVRVFKVEQVLLAALFQIIITHNVCCRCWTICWS